LPDVWRADARSAQIGGPDCISQSFQVSTYSGEPFTSSLARNLLAKRRCSFSEGDKVAEDRPEVALVRFAEPLAGAREGLTGARACPNRSVIGPAGETQGIGPPSDSGKEVLLCVSSEFMRSDIDDAPFVHVAVGDESGADEFAQPFCRSTVMFVVVCTHKV
jgi:hypothetical protein